MITLASVTITLVVGLIMLVAHAQTDIDQPRTFMVVILVLRLVLI